MKKFILALLVAITSAHASMTVSGLSSGGYFAHQFHVAFSSQVSGAGILAGGPFWCAKGNVNDALNRCMDTAGGAPRVDDSLNEATRREREGRIDSLKNLATSRVFLVSGTADRTVLPVMSQRLRESYKAWGVTDKHLTVIDRLPVGHAFPTMDYGNPCEDPSNPPYISNCGRDIAGEMLTALISGVKDRTEPNEERIFEFPQAQGVDPSGISLA